MAQACVKKIRDIKAAAEDLHEEPATAAIAINLACSIFILPESTSHFALSHILELVDNAARGIPYVKTYLSDPASSTHDHEIRSLKSKTIERWTALESALNFVSFDFSFGYWGAQDIIGIKEPLIHLIANSVLLLDDPLEMHDRRQRCERFIANSTPEELSKQHGRHQIMATLQIMDMIRHPDTARSFGNAFDAVSEAIEPLLSACDESFSAISDCILNSNSRRWFKALSPDEWQKLHQKRSKTLENLRYELGLFQKSAPRLLIERCKGTDSAAEKADHGIDQCRSSAGVFVGSNVMDRLLHFAQSLESLLAYVNDLESRRHQRRLGLPSQISNFFSWTTKKSDTPTMAMDPLERVATISSESTLKKDSPLRFERVRLPGRKRAPLSRVIIGFGQWLTNDEGVFALRILAATMIISVLAVTNRTAGFFYREKGLWGLIMAQSGMAVQFADFTFGFVSRLIVTVVGGVVGMIAWYVGSGSGSGNPYGLSAVMAVVSVLVMAVRLWTPPRHMGAVVMGSSTAVLVVGYGYLDT